MSFISDIRRAVNNLANSPPPPPYSGGGYGQSAQFGTYTPKQYNLRETVSIKLDGSGNGTARITPVGPRNGGLSWQVSGVSVSAATNVLEASGNLFVSFGIQSSGALDQMANTSKASSGDSCALPGVNLRPGDWITFVWSGGDAGATASMVVTGIVNPPGSGS